MDCLVLSQSVDPNDAKACRDLLRAAIPSWDHLTDESITLKTLVGGYTNKLFKATTLAPRVEPRAVLIRFFGHDSDAFIDRQFETTIVVRLHRLGLAAPLYATFHNGTVYGYSEGRSVVEAELPDAHLQKLIATELAAWHTRTIPDIPHEPILFDTLRKWTQLDHGHSQLDLFGKYTITMTSLQKQIDKAERVLRRLQSPAVLSHNDLLPGNIIYNEKTGRVHFIDQEYTRYNFRGFDIGNHFCEYLGFDNYDYERYPPRRVQEVFLRAYLAAIHKGSKVTKADVEKLYLEATGFALIANVFWGLWALYQSKVSENRVNFDYLRYGKSRLLAFYIYKDRVYQTVSQAKL